MEDCYGRTIDYMRVSITDRCNLRCRYCMPDGIRLVPMEKVLTYEEIEQICRAAAREGIRNIKITGGEPLARIGCEDLIRRIKQIPGIRQVTMTTNGVLLAKRLSQLTDAGLDAVNVSLDTLEPDVYREIAGSDQLDQVLEGIDLALEAGLPVKLNCVLLKGVNDREWLDLARLTISRPMDVRFIEMMPIGRGKTFEPVDNEEILKKMKEEDPEIRKDETVHGNGPAVYYRFSNGKGSVGFISAVHRKFCKTCNRIRLTAQGQLKPCLCFGKNVNLIEILRQEDKEQAEKDLQKAVREAVFMKPESHVFEHLDEVTEEKNMIQIGG